MLKRVILLFSPYFIDNYKFYSDDDIFFFDSSSLKNDCEGKENLDIDKLLNLSHIDFSAFFKKANFLENDNENIVLVNFPRNNNIALRELFNDFLKKKESFDLLSDSDSDKVSFYIVLINVDDYEWMKDIRENYLLCPFCERISFIEEVEKPETSKEKKFFCKFNDSHQFSLDFVRKFSDSFFSYYIENTRKTMDEFKEEFGEDNMSLIRINKEDLEDEHFFEKLKNDTLKKLKLNK